MTRGNLAEWLLAWLSIGLFACLTCRAETVQLVTYYNYSPWYFDASPERGLNAELARRLTAMSAGKYQFESVYVPRKRIDAMIQGGTKMVVPWVAPHFFGDADRTKFLWTAPLMQDESLIVSSKNAPLEYDGPNSLRGKAFSAPAGHLFPDFSDLIASGQIRRDDAPSIKNALMKLLLTRNVDFAVIDRSTFNALKADESMDMSKFHLARVPRTPSYARHILVTRNNPVLFEFVSKAVTRLSREEGWIDLSMYSKPPVGLHR